jgi:PAS domain S-box-containing protein
MQNSARGGFLLPVVAGIAYFALGYMVAHMPDVPTNSAYAWFGAGVMLGPLLVAPIGRWPLYMGAIGVAALAAAGLWLDISWLERVLLVAGELVIAGTAAWLLRRAVGGPLAFDSLTSVALFLAIAVVGGGVCAAAVGAPVTSQLYGDTYLHRFEFRFFSHVVGVLVVAPAIVAWAHWRPKRSGGMSRYEFLVGAAAYLLLLASAQWVFDGDPATRFDNLGGFALTYVPIPFLVLTSLAWGLRGGSIAVLGLAFIAILNASQGEGPFAAAYLESGGAVIETQGYLIVNALLAILMAAVRSAEKRADDTAAEWRSRFESAVGAAGSLVYEVDPRAGTIAWGGDPRKLTGYAAAELATIAQWFERVHPDDRADLKRHFDDLASGAQASAAMQYRIARADGATVVVDHDGSAIADFNDSVHRITGLVREARHLPVFDRPAA